MRNFIFGIILLFLSFLFINSAEYSIQLGSFNTEKQALNGINNLKGKIDIDKCYVVTADLKEKGIWFRVRYGRFRDKQIAEQELEKIKRTGLDAIVTFYSSPGHDIPYSDTLKEKPPMVKEDQEKVIVEEKKSEKVKPSKQEEKFASQKVLDKTFDFRIEILNKLWVKAIQERDSEAVRKLIEKYNQLFLDFYESSYRYKAQYMISRCYLEFKDYENTLTHIDLAIEHAPDSEKASLIYEKGFVFYIFLNNYEKAIDAFKRVSLEHPKSNWAIAAQNSINEILKYKIFNY